MCVAPSRQSARVLDSPTSLRWLLGAVLVVAASCDDDTPRYSATALADGVEVAVDDPDGVIDSATVFLPDELPSYLSLHPQLDENGIAVLQPGEGGFDVVVVYRTGPFCGLLPEVSASGDGSHIAIDVRTRSTGDCDSVEHDEAVGLQIAVGHESDPVQADRS